MNWLSIVLTEELFSGATTIAAKGDDRIYDRNSATKAKERQASFEGFPTERQRNPGTTGKDVVVCHYCRLPLLSKNLS